MRRGSLAGGASGVTAKRRMGRLPPWSRIRTARACDWIYVGSTAAHRDPAWLRGVDWGHESGLVGGAPAAAQRGHRLGALPGRERARPVRARLARPADP